LITKSQVMSLLVEACPSYADRFQRYLSDNYDDGDERFLYCELGDFADHLCDLLELGSDSEFTDVFAVIESLHIDGDDFVREAATIGMLEGIQNVSSWRESISPNDFEKYLGVTSRKWWNELNGFWQGKRNYVGEGLEDPDVGT